MMISVVMMIFQNGISNENARGGRRKLPYAYTEQGISMLSAVLRSEVGKKCFTINKIEDKIIVADILNRLSPKKGGE